MNPEPTMPHILIVGAADTGRAPLAVALLQRLLRRRNLGWPVASAGVVGHDEAPAQPEARDAGAALGLDIGEHRARSLDDAMVAQAALLIAVDRGVARVLRERYPAAQTVALGELAGTRRDIPDPFRMQVGAWISYAQEIEAMLRSGMERIVTIVAQQGDRGTATGASRDAPTEDSQPPPTANQGEAPTPVHPPPAPEHTGALHAPASPSSTSIAHLARIDRLLALRAELPEVVAWDGARRQIGADLADLKAQHPGPLAAPYLAIVEAMLNLCGNSPTPAQLAALRGAVARLSRPIDQAAIAAASALLAGEFAA